MSWEIVPISEVAEIVAGATPKTSVSEFWDGKINWATPADLSDLKGSYIGETPRKISEAGLKSCAATILPTNSVLFSSRAPIGHVAINSSPMATNQGFKSFIPNAKKLEPKYLYWWLKSHKPQLEAMGNGATFKEVSKKTVSRVKIPLPPLDEQKRIAAILDKADHLRQKRRQAIALLNSLTQSIFLEMFGDPVSNPMGWDQGALSDIADFMSGGTPSKSSPSFWVGQIPWVSPKDMKSVIIRDAIDHISETAVRQSAVKVAPKNAVLIVVRGMILAHSAPVGILSREAAFNQDIKSIVFHDDIDPRFGLWTLLSQRSAILQKVSTAAHGTKRLETENLLKLPVLRPPIALQKQFADQHDLILGSLTRFKKAAAEGNSLFKALQSTLFMAEANVQ